MGTYSLIHPFMPLVHFGHLLHCGIRCERWCSDKYYYSFLHHVSYMSHTVIYTHIYIHTLTITF